jgi:hypothetical protein
VLDDPLGLPVNGVQSWQSGYLPPVYQGTRFRSTGEPLLNLQPDRPQPAEVTRIQQDLLARLDRIHQQQRPGQLQLDARIASYELAARMQLEATDVLDLRRESQATLEMYGVGREPTDSYARRCLMARRLVERGVRCVTVNMFTSLADGPTWDAHGGRVRGGVAACAEHVVPVFDRAFATLLADLDARGLLARTLVVAAGEMGRSPRMNRRGGRDHWTRCWSVAMAGAGVRGGQVIGASDRFGAEPVEGAVHAGRLFRMIRQALFAHGMSHV